MSTSAQSGIADLLERAGAAPPRYGRGKWTCPDCGRPDLSVNLDRGVFNCFHDGCDFRGGVGTLRKRLGIERKWLPRDEYIRQQQERERAHEAAERLYSSVKARRFRLLDQIHDLNRIEVGAHRAGPGRLGVWDALALVYRERPGLLAELTFLENAPARSLVQFLDATPAQRQAVCDTIMEHGGMYDYAGRFVEVAS